MYIYMQILMCMYVHMLMYIHICCCWPHALQLLTNYDNVFPLLTNYVELTVPVSEFLQKH